MVQNPVVVCHLLVHCAMSVIVVVRARSAQS